MKRIISAVLTAVAFVALSVVPALAADVAIEVSTEEASPGESVTLTFTLSGNPGIAAYSADLIYDQSALELTGAASGQDLRALTFLKYIPNNRVAAFSATNATKNGVMFTATFRVLDGAKAGLAPVTLNVTEMVSASYEYFTPTITSGGVTVVPAGTAAGSPGAAEDPTATDVPDDPIRTEDPAAGDDVPPEDDEPLNLEDILTNDIFTGNGVDIDVEDIFEAMGIERDPSVPPPATDSASGEVFTGAAPVGEPEQLPAEAEPLPEGESDSGASPAVWIIPVVVVACAAVGAYIIIYRKKQATSSKAE